MKLRIGSHRNTQEIVVLVDTGFTGEVKVSENLARQLNLKVTHTEQVILANETELRWEAASAIVDMENRRQSINVLIGKGEFPIVGIGLLRRFAYDLRLDLKYDILTLEKY